MPSGKFLFLEGRDQKGELLRLPFKFEEYRLKQLGWYAEETDYEISEISCGTEIIKEELWMLLAKAETVQQDEKTCLHGFLPK